MKIFGARNNPKPLHITETDRAWVEENLKWLLRVFGYPNPSMKPILPDTASFPHSFSKAAVDPGSLIKDLSALLSIEPGTINYHVEKDIRDTSGTPYELHGEVFETDTSEDNGVYNIAIANELLGHPGRLLFCLILECTYISMNESGLQHDTGEDDLQFRYLAAIHLGFGLILCQHLSFKGSSSDGVWQKTWNYPSALPLEVMAFAMALYGSYSEHDMDKWKSYLPNELWRLIQQALRLLEQEPSSLVDKSEVQASLLYEASNAAAASFNFDEAIEQLRKLLFLTRDDMLRVMAYNNIGYCQQRKGEWASSILNFQLALDIDPGFAYANDNLGYSFLRMGDLDSGSYYIRKADESGENVKGYSLRNIALYYELKGMPEEAAAHYQQALETGDTVDLLEYHYGAFLLQQGKKAEALEYLKISAEKSEPEGKQAIHDLHQ